MVTRRERKREKGVGWKRGGQPCEEPEISKEARETRSQKTEGTKEKLPEER